MLVIFSLFMMLVGLFTLVRNTYVFAERIKMNYLIARQEDWEYLFDLKEQFSYEYMLFRFWVWPVSRLWPQELQELGK